MPADLSGAIEVPINHRVAIETGEMQVHKVIATEHHVNVTIVREETGVTRRQLLSKVIEASRDALA